MNDKYITIQEAAKTLGVSRTTIRNFLYKHHLFKGKRFGKQIRIDRQSFYDYIEKSEIKK